MADFLAECNQFQIPEADFGAQFCGRCRNSDCSRSATNSDFGARTAAWQEIYFVGLRRADPTSEFAQARQRAFNEAPPPAWVDSPNRRANVNTPFRQGSALPNAPTPTPPADPWAGSAQVRTAPRGASVGPGNKVVLGEK